MVRVEFRGHGKTLGCPSYDNLWLGLNLEVFVMIRGAELDAVDHGIEVGTVNRGADLWPRQRHVASHVIQDLQPRRRDLGVVGHW